MQHHSTTVSFHVRDRELPTLLTKKYSFRPVRLQFKRSFAAFSPHGLQHENFETDDLWCDNFQFGIFSNLESVRSNASVAALYPSHINVALLF